MEVESLCLKGVLPDLVEIRDVSLIVGNDPFPEHLLLFNWKDGEVSGDRSGDVAVRLIVDGLLSVLERDGRTGLLVEELGERRTQRAKLVLEVCIALEHPIGHFIAILVENIDRGVAFAHVGLGV